MAMDLVDLGSCAEKISMDPVDLGSCKEMVLMDLVDLGSCANVSYFHKHIYAWKANGKTSSLNYLICVTLHHLLACVTAYLKHEH